MSSIPINKVRTFFFIMFPILTHSIQTNKVTFSAFENLSQLDKSQTVRPHHINGRKYLNITLESDHGRISANQHKRNLYEETDVNPVVRSGRILTKSSKDWGDAFGEILTEKGVQEPIGIVITTELNDQQCSRRWRQMVLNADVTFKGQVPSILMATVDQEGNIFENKIYLKAGLGFSNFQTRKNRSFQN